MAYVTGMGLIISLTSTQAKIISISNITVDRDLDCQIPHLSSSTIFLCTRLLYRSRGRNTRVVGVPLSTGRFHFNRKPGSSTPDTVSASFDMPDWPESTEGTCANLNCPRNAHCVKVNKTYKECRVTGCLDRPAVEYGHFLNETDSSPLGSVLTLICDQGYMPVGEVTCRNNGTWSPAVCVSISSCRMVKQYQPVSGDGEYWLRLTNFDNYTARIYCHRMQTPSPEEYLTLPNINYGIFPNVSNDKCIDGADQGFACVGQAGEIWYSKIRVNITTMKVLSKDKTFTNISMNGSRLYYGEAADCYARHPNSKLRCGTKGKFIIDLRETGWKVNKDQKWRMFGYQALTEIIDSQRNETLIKIHCGGYVGGCKPDGGLSLIPFPEDLPRSTAK